MLYSYACICLYVVLMINGYCKFVLYDLTIILSYGNLARNYFLEVKILVGVLQGFL